MDKINITLSSGNTLEKPLLSAFKGSNGTYVVLDNELNGTMGLPIILVSKLNGNNLEIISDSNEWSTVKEYLRNIIAGNQMDYVAVPNALSAQDSFFKQLTLPVASFEALKANYKPMDVNVAPVVEPQTVEEQPVVETPVMPQMPSAVPTPEPVITPIEQPVVEPVAPVMPEAPAAQSVNAFTPVEPAPVVEPIPAASSQPIDFTADKEAFMKACENMFDALVAKFNK